MQINPKHNFTELKAYVTPAMLQVNSLKRIQTCSLFASLPMKMHLDFH